MRQEHQNDQPDRADQIAEIYDCPVAEHLPGRHMAARPGHHDQIVSRKELGSANDNDHEPEGKYQSAHDARGGKAQPGIADDDGIVERAQADAATCDHRQHQRRPQRKVGFLYSDFLDGLLDLGRAVSVQIEDRWLRWGCPIRHAAPPVCDRPANADIARIRPGERLSPEPPIYAIRLTNGGPFWISRFPRCFQP